jgi:hypothetical protein
MKQGQVKFSQQELVMMRIDTRDFIVLIDDNNDT